LITRSAEGDSFDVMGPIAAVQPATDHQAYLGYLRRPELAAATITVSEAGYLRGPDGHLDLGRAVITADLAALQGNIEAPVSSLPGKLVAGLLARRAADAGPISILSCDNLPENGAVTRAVVTDLAAVVDATLQTWMEQNVDFATSMVDRITPATTAEERSLVAKAQGYEDASPVPTEPFAEWVISGRFPNGRAAWEDAGARLVEDITPYEQRKLWLLNASHSLLAYAGSICGHATIDEAIGDPQCRSWVEALWEESCRHLTLPAAMLADYRAALIQRFANPRVRDQLSRIAADGSQKLPVRILPPLLAERADRRMPVGCATAVAAWILHLRGHGAPIKDPGADRARVAAGADHKSTAVSAVLETLHSGLGNDSALVEVIIEQMQALTEQR
jgi:fructuronate reductase